MRPANTVRRAALADAAIRVLAETGIRGLTHRAVDAAAAEPDGTASRYFRSRETMLLGVVERLRELQLADLAAIEAPQLDRARLVDALVATVNDALSNGRHRQLATMALFLESTHRPALRDALGEVATALRETLKRLSARAGVELTETDAWALFSHINGVVFLGLTLPELDQPTSATIRSGVGAILARYPA